MVLYLLVLISTCFADSPDPEWDDYLERVHDRSLDGELVLRCHEHFHLEGTDSKGHLVLKLIREDCCWTHLENHECV